MTGQAEGLSISLCLIWLFSVINSIKLFLLISDMTLNRPQDKSVFFLFLSQNTCMFKLIDKKIIAILR